MSLDGLVVGMIGSKQVERSGCELVIVECDMYEERRSGVYALIVGVVVCALCTTLFVIDQLYSLFPYDEVARGSSLSLNMTMAFFGLLGISVLMAFGMIVKRWRSSVRAAIMLVWGAAIGIMCSGCTSTLAMQVMRQSKIEAIKREVSDLPAAIERYHQERGEFAARFEELQQAGYLDEVPVLPSYCGLPMVEHHDEQWGIVIQCTLNFRPGDPHHGHGCVCGSHNSNSYRIVYRHQTDKWHHGKETDIYEHKDMNLYIKPPPEPEVINF